MKHLLIIDPGTTLPEVDAYNLLIRMVHEVPATDLLPHLFLPCMAGGRLSDLKLEVAGIIMLGSYANVTQNLEWVNSLSKELASFLDGGVPFLGICFAHQLWAHMNAGEVGYLKNRENTPKLTGVRMSKIVHPKLQLIFAKSAETEDNFRKCLKMQKDFDSQNWDRIAKKQYASREEFFFGEYLNAHCPTTFEAEVEHEQEVLSLLSGDLCLAVSSDACQIDGLVHARFPQFSVQSHPEIWHSSEDGWRMLKNFIQLLAINSDL